MLKRTLRRSLSGLLPLALLTVGSAEVARVEIAERVDIGTSGYEKIIGTLHFAVDPAHPQNGLIADLGHAPINTAGRVEFSSDFFIMKPKDPGRSNGAVLVEISNRGSRFVLRRFHRGGTSNPLTEADLGDGFLFRQGFTLMSVGWEFDVPDRPGLMRIRVPVATDAGRPIRGIVRATIVVDAPVQEFTVTDLATYLPIDPNGPDTRLTVRDSASMPGGSEIPREQWSLQGHTVVIDGGFEPGRTYEISYQTSAPPITGLGFAAIRDAVAWLKHGPDSPAPVRYAYAFGSSQSGRFLRTFLYQGFNTDERDRAVLDGVMAHVAGASRLDLNHRWAVTRERGMFKVAAYPFADTAQPDPISGRREGLLENARVQHPPKIVYTNTSAEYWGGGRVAALVHTDPAGSRDITLPDNVRLYVFAGTQHGPAAFPPPPQTVTQEYGNPVNFWANMRALLVALHRWVQDGTPPPPSAYPTFGDGTLVRAAEVTFPELPGVKSPRRLDAGVRMPNPLYSDGAGAGAALPLLVPQVDADGNELAGIRLPEIAVPLATYTGWMFRPPALGLPGNLVPLRGTWIPFAKTRRERIARQDPRSSIEERYASREEYLKRSQAAAEALVQQGYLLAEDLDWVQERAAARWDWTAGQAAAR